jgi:hypothetical protein
MKYRPTVVEYDVEMWKGSKQGACPRCGKRDLDYGAMELEAGDCYFPFTCGKCKATGEEWYHLEYCDSIVKVEDNN